MKSPQQQLFDHLFLMSLNLGYETYMDLPPDGANYPFVYIGEQFTNDIANKTNVMGEVTQYIRIYGSNESRRQVTDLVNDLVREIRKLRHTDTFYVSVNALRQQVMVETVTPSKPIVGRIEIDFKFN